MIASGSDVDAPGPRALPGIGSILPFLRDKHGFLARCAREYGDVVRLEIGRATYLLRNPDDIRHVLVSNADNYAKTPRIAGTRAKKFFGDGVVTAVGAAHLRQRRMLQPLFHHGVIERFASSITGCVGEMLGRWEGSESADINTEMLELMQRITTRVWFGDETTQETRRFSRAISVRRRYQEYLLGSVNPFAGYLPSRIKREHARANRDIIAIVGVSICERRGSGGQAADTRDMLDMLCAARYDDGSSMSESQICDEVRTMAVAGYETLAEALTWTWYLLATTADAEARVFAEADAIPRDRDITVADLPRLAYCRMVLAEALRLYPPSWLIVRVAERSDLLPSGARIPARAKIYLSPWVSHRNPRYFPEPDRFDPLRFSEDAVRARPRLAYFPFGAGRRLCIGEEFAWMEGVLLIASIARRYRLTVCPGQVIEPQANVTMRPKRGIRMRLTRR